MAALVVRVRLPSVVNAARLIAVEPLSRVMCARFEPAVWVVNVMAPVKALELFNVMALSLTSVVKLDVPVTVMTPESVIASPDVTVRLPPTVTVPRLRAVAPLSMMTWPLAPVVLKLTAPVKALVAVSRVMALLATSVVKLEVPVTVNAAVCVIASLDVTERLPFTV